MKRLANLILLIAAAGTFLAGCTRVVKFETPQIKQALIPVSAAEIEFCDDLDLQSLLLAIDRSLDYYGSVGRNQVFHAGEKTFSAGQMIDSLKTFRQVMESRVSWEEKKRIIFADFDVYRAAGAAASGEVLFTGYYTPVLEGSLERTYRFRYPLYRVPPDLQEKTKSAAGAPEDRQVAYYYSRREIDMGGVLQNISLELIWVADPVELFFLHIQGSGRIRLEGGQGVTVGVHKTNGRPYRSMPEGILQQVRRDKGSASYANVKAWLKDKGDDELNEILSYYERYVFFRFLDKDPLGAIGQPVTPARSIATDPDCFPPGAPAFIRLTKPVFDDTGRLLRREAFSRFVLNQDRGAAIKGPGRVDLFCGFGPEAEAVAGSLKERGELYFLLPK